MGGRKAPGAATTMRLVALLLENRPRTRVASPPGKRRRAGGAEPAPPPPPEVAELLAGLGASVADAWPALLRLGYEPADGIKQLGELLEKRDAGETRLTVFQIRRIKPAASKIAAKEAAAQQAAAAAGPAAAALAPKKEVVDLTRDD